MTKKDFREHPGSESPRFAVGSDGRRDTPGLTQAVAIVAFCLAVFLAAPFLSL